MQEWRHEVYVSWWFWLVSNVSYQNGLVCIYVTQGVIEETSLHIGIQYHLTNWCSMRLIVQRSKILMHKMILVLSCFVVFGALMITGQLGESNLWGMLKNYNLVLCFFGQFS